MDDNTPYLRFTGILDPDGSFERGFGWTTQRIRKPQEPNTPLVVELVDDRGEPIHRVGVHAEVRDREGELDLPAHRIVAYLPYAEGARGVRLLLGDREVHHEELAAEPPSVSLRVLEVGEERVRVEWDAKHDRSVRFNVFLTDDRPTTYTLATGLEERMLDLEVAALPTGGLCRVSVLATDGLRSAVVTSEPFELPFLVTTAVIVEPRDGETLSPIQPLSLSGSAQEANRTRSPRSAVWSLDGVEVAWGEWNAVVATPEVGEHVLTLTVGTSGKHAAETSVRIVIGEPTEDEAEWSRGASELDGL